MVLLGFLFVVGFLFLLLRQEFIRGFSMSGANNLYFCSRVSLLAFLNLISLVCFRYPVTTTLGFNFTVAFFL